MNNKYLIVFLTFLFFITVGFIIYLNSSSDIPVVYGSSDPIRELPSNVPELVRPSSIPCIYSLWKNSNESCGSSENIFEEKKLIINIFHCYLVLFQVKGMLKFTSRS